MKPKYIPYNYMDPLGLANASSLCKGPWADEGLMLAEGFTGSVQCLGYQSLESPVNQILGLGHMSSTYGLSNNGLTYMATGLLLLP